MYSQPLRFAGLQGLCAASAATLLLAAAVLLPAPELHAQDLGGGSVIRLIGSPSSSPAPIMSRVATRELLARYFPDVLRGEGPESVVFIRDAAGRVIGTMPMQSAERIIEFLQRETETSSSEPGNPGRIELRQKKAFLEQEQTQQLKELFQKEAMVRKQELRQEKEPSPEQDSLQRKKAFLKKELLEQNDARQQLELRQKQERLSGDLTDTIKRSVQEKAERELTESLQRALKLVARTGTGGDGKRAFTTGDQVKVAYRPGYPLQEELTAEQRNTAERVVSADRVEHGAGEVGPQAVRVVFLTLRRGS